MSLAQMETAVKGVSFHMCEKTITRPPRNTTMVTNNQFIQKKLNLTPEDSSKRTVETISSVFRTFALRSSSRNIFTNIKLSTVEAFLRCGNFCMTDGEIYKSIGLCLPHSVRFSKIDVRSAMEQILIEGSVARHGLYDIKSANGTILGVIKLWNLNPECIVDCLRIALVQIQRADAHLAQMCKQNIQSVSNSEELLCPTLMEDLMAYAICRQIEFVGKVSSLTICLNSTTIKMSDADLIRIVKPFPPEKWTTSFISSIHSGVLTSRWVKSEAISPDKVPAFNRDLSDQAELDIGSIIREFVIAI